MLVQNTSVIVLLQPLVEDVLHAVHDVSGDVDLVEGVINGVVEL